VRDRGHADLNLDGWCDPPPNSDPIAQAYAELLQRRPWHWFVTLTFKPDHERTSGGMHPEKADKCYRVLISKINREIYGVRWYKRPDGGLQWARGQEFHKSGKIHFHAVVAAPNDDLNALTRRMRWVDFWWREFGIARIEPPESQEDVNAYVSKYVTKDGEVDFSPNFDRYVPPAIEFGHRPPPSAASSTRHLTQTLKRSERSNEGTRPGASRCLTLPVRPQRVLLNPNNSTTGTSNDERSTLTRRIEDARRRIASRAPI
jgi:hypothetical protein